MVERALLSVIIPTHETRELTLRCLETLTRAARQDTGPVEIRVVDDGSTDGTTEAIRRHYPDVELLRHQCSRGFTAAVNQGVASSHGELILLLNSDTEVEPGALSSLRRALDDNPEIGIVGATLLYPDGSSQWSGGGEPTLPWLFLLASGLPGLLARIPGYRRLRPVSGARSRSPIDWVTGAALAMRRAVWTEVGPLDTGYRFYGQDLDLCCRARQKGWEVHVLPDFRVLHHHGATIGRSGEMTEATHDPVLLWTDLLYWARRHRGVRWSRRARRSLRWGARLRLFGYRLSGLLQPNPSPARGRRDTESFRRALEALETSPRLDEPLP